MVQGDGECVADLGNQFLCRVPCAVKEHGVEFFSLGWLDGDRPLA